MSDLFDEVQRVINRLDSSDPDFADCVDAVALIERMKCEIAGPDGYATWKDAAVHERQSRVDVEARLAAAEADAARYRYLKASGAFRTSLPDMSGKHTWSGVGRPIGVGYTIDDAIDKAKENM